MSSRLPVSTITANGDLASNSVGLTQASSTTTSSPATGFAALWAWCKDGAQDTVVPFLVRNSNEVVSLAVDSCSVLGMGAGAANPAIKTSAPWFLKMLSPASPAYHLQKGLVYLDEAFALLQQDGDDMPRTLSMKLHDWYDQLLNTRNTLADRVPQSRARNREWKAQTQALLELTKRSSKEAQSRRLRNQRYNRGNGPSQRSQLGAIPEGSNTTTAPTSQAGTTDVSDTGEPNNDGPFGDDSRVDSPTGDNGSGDADD
ncbi:hypothetical protein C8Q76DRAFT_789599 [Earliella scabrosa]|nr:hypothetical protein C8Q76DRAFT_789599 [Earliella scabrosa]